MTLVFARKPSPDLTRLVKAIDAQVTASQGKAAAFVVFLPDDAAAATPQIEAFAARQKIAVPLTVPVNMAEVKEKFNITPGDAMPVHVLVYRDKKVQKPFALTQITSGDVQAVQAAMKKNVA